MYLSGLYLSCLNRSQSFLNFSLPSISKASSILFFLTKSSRAIITLSFFVLLLANLIASFNNSSGISNVVFIIYLLLKIIYIHNRQFYMSCQQLLIFPRAYINPSSLHNPSSLAILTASSNSSLVILLFIGGCSNAL